MLTLESQTLNLPADSNEAAQIIRESMSASFWLKKAMGDLIERRDPLDMARDAEILAAVARQRCKELGI